MSRQVFNLISLFAGAGGLEIAACSTGKVQKILSTDFNATFLETTRVNLPEHYPTVMHDTLAADVRELSGQKLIEIQGDQPDLVMGGPPCDDFTRFGRHRGMSGDKGPLIFEYLRIVDELQPRCFLFENVANLAQQFRQIFEDFLQHADAMDYHVNWRLLPAADYGSPTMRKRIIAVGWQRSHRVDKRAFEFPEPTHGDQQQPNLFNVATKPLATVGDVLADLPDVTEPRAAQYYNHTGRTHRPKTVEHIKTVPQGIHMKKSFRYRAPWNGLCSSLTAGLDDSTKSYIHPFYHREMSVREYARLQGFPDSWVFQGTHHNGIKQVANAVPIPLGKAVLTSVMEALYENA
jgi:DNA (cytosine-5)-methyltransferase 1